MHLTRLYCRRMDPSKSEFVRKGLSERFSNRNMRKVKISAQVTATFTLLEAFGNCVNVVIWMSMASPVQDKSFYKQTGPLPTGMLLSFVLLPYIFLMNTGHNRSRVVDNGWANVLKNVLPCNSASLPNDNQRVDDNNPRENAQVQQSIKCKWGVFRSINTKQRSIVKPFSNQDGCKDNNDSAIYTIFRKEHCLPSISNDVNSLNMNVPIYEGPCTSKSAMQNYTRSISQDDDSDLQDKESRIYLRSQIVSSMLSNVRNEKLYIKYFTRLLSFEDALKNGHVSNDISSDYLCTVSLADTTTKTKSKGKKSKHSGYTLENQLGSSEMKNNWCSDTIETVKEGIKDNEHNCIGDIKSRIEMRTIFLRSKIDMINSMQFNEYGESLYEEFFNRLIEMEEDFIEDNC